MGVRCRTEDKLKKIKSGNQELLAKEYTKEK